MQPTIALATGKAWPEGTPDEAPLTRALEAAGWRWRWVPWDEPGVDWAGFDLVLIRTTWDYFLFIDRFRGWVEHAARAGANVWNPSDVLLWNSDKRYLQELARAGVPTVPTRVVPREAADRLAYVLEETGWEEVVVKPAVSGGAWGTFRATRDDPREQLFAQQKAHGAVLVQPFLPEVQQGEWSFVFFDREFSHAVLKLPGEGDFRVQEKHGGSYARAHPSASQVAEARAVLDAVKGELLYARVDMVELGGKLTLMELEVLEPQLFFGAAPGSAERCAEAVRKRL